ncbi:hypothetical protein PHYSODRAFT_294779 [Phytophthora sojae]|uniref:Uncharacterized protein n=1 Tax=Phytophthora sojae (strain P6497) TaxID=1094619 RepID=G4YL26_PHYSP|nr:hypothetical protein PHYSODRAFT_294779 [Phytophthora sojae]EGZ29781.1 hypothetical protein PHYSODRAFT_294779 [Phytophthora sojae]|eukprot:XP_009517056.1 hypothetical protein PHYSODRAFT_294779 [Phytophthora sojae]
MADTVIREHKRLRLTSPDANVNAKADAWDFLSPWFEQLKGSLTVTSDGYLQVLYQQPRWIRRGRPNPYDICEWHTREALELLVLVHSVNNRAWVKILKEKCELRFEEEEEGDVSDTGSDEEGEDDDAETFKFECEHDREVPLSPRFKFEMDVGYQHARPCYKPSLEFLAAKQRILMMQDEVFKTHPHVPRSIEIPVSFEVASSSRENNDAVVAHMLELRELIEAMKSYSKQQVGDSNSLDDCARTFTYCLDELSISISDVNVTEARVESVLRVLGTGVAIERLEVDLYREPDSPASRKNLAKLLIGLLVHSIGTFVFVSGRDWHCDALCSTLAVARTPVGTLQLRGRSQYSDRGRLLAGALFCSRMPRCTSYPPIDRLDISDSTFYSFQLKDFEDAIKEKDFWYSLGLTSCMGWQLPEGTMLCFDDGDIVTKHAISIPVDTNMKLLPASTGDRSGMVGLQSPVFPLDERWKDDDIYPEVVPEADEYVDRAAHYTFEPFTGETKPELTSLAIRDVEHIGRDHANGSTAVNDSTLEALWMALQNNTRLKKLSLIAPFRAITPWGNRFRQFHRQVLPPTPLGLASKLAFLSAVSIDFEVNTAGELPSALQKLDQHPVSLIFEFAATRVIRSVEILIGD